MKTEVPETLQFTLFEGSGGLKQKSFVFKGFSKTAIWTPWRRGNVYIYTNPGRSERRNAEMCEMMRKWKIWGRRRER